MLRYDGLCGRSKLSAFPALSPLADPLRLPPAASLLVVDLRLGYLHARNHRKLFIDDLGDELFACSWFKPVRSRRETGV